MKAPLTVFPSKRVTPCGPKIVYVLRTLLLLAISEMLPVPLVTPTPLGLNGEHRKPDPTTLCLRVHRHITSRGRVLASS